ncbi:MAG: hypothetical protein ACYDBB_00415 [Armatimonadota bacterium]
MGKLSITRSAADNTYLHKDFHGALSTGIEYLHQHYGEEAVRGYLHQFAATFYAPLTRAINERGLVAMQEHLERTYTLEGGEVTLDFTGEQLTLHVKTCPAVMHMREQGYPVARMFSETSRTVYATICEGTPFAVEILAYDERTGACCVRFTRRTA